MYRKTAIIELKQKNANFFFCIAKIVTTKGLINKPNSLIRVKNSFQQNYRFQLERENNTLM